MIIKKGFRGRSTTITKRRARALAMNGKVCVSLHQWSGNTLDYDAVIEPIELREIRDACNLALGQITGHEYTTTVRVK